jgi:allantoicase
VSVDALYSIGDSPTNEDSQVVVGPPLIPSDGLTFTQWKEILPKAPLGPSSRHLFRIPETEGVNYVKLNMYPDGGIVRVNKWFMLFDTNDVVCRLDFASMAWSCRYYQRVYRRPSTWHMSSLEGE